ncbi:MAG: DMT family transporter [Actinobacteria bacterium]|nr:DMT family transporter [Actinomycetota bacterium]
MTPVALALASAVLFGGMTVALRLALVRRPGAQAATAATVVTAFAVALGAVAVEATRTDLVLDGAWAFALAGFLAPGGSQILFTLAVRDAGPSRASVAVGAAPLVSVALALALLDEPPRVALLVGAALVVGGGLALALERTRPEHVRRIGLVYAVAATLLFASRDNLVRWLAAGDVGPAVAAAATLATGLAVALAFSRGLPSRERIAAFAPAGALFGLSYVFLFEALFRAPVTVVTPLVATESLWGVFLSVVLLRRTELVGVRLLVGALLVVAGGALIGATRAG